MFNYKNIDFNYKLLCLLFLIIYTILIQNIISLLFIVFIYYLVTKKYINGCYCILYLFILIGIMINELNSSTLFLKTSIILYFIYYSVISIDLNHIRNYIIKYRLKMNNINNNLDNDCILYLKKELDKINVISNDLNINYHNINKEKLKEINYLRFGIDSINHNKFSISNMSYVLCNVIIIVVSFFLG